MCWAARSLAKTHLTEPLAHLGLARQFTDPASRAYRKLGEAHPLRAKTVGK
jgi:hypothetical protein